MSRMDRYETSNIKERTEKNKKLYETVTDIDVDYIDVNNATVIDNNYNNSNLTRSEYQQRKEIDKLIQTPKEKEELDIKEEKSDDRIYDINEILKLARENKLFENDDKKRLINTEYNILTKLDISEIEKQDNNKEDLRELIDKVYGNSKKAKPKKENTGGLLDDLMVEEPILSEETSKDILDKDSNTIILDKDDEIIPKLIPDEEEKNDKEEVKKEDNETEEVNDDEEKTKVLEIEKISKKEKKNKLKKQKNIEVTKEEIEDEEDDEDENFLDEEIGKSKKVLVFIIILVIIILLAISYLFYKYFL